MAERRPENVEGPWYVDDSCIDCGACMWIAPQVFAEAGAMSAVHRQPDARATPEAEVALVSCPTGSIKGPADMMRAVGAFPRAVAPNVWHLGFHARSSFGATPYLVETKKGRAMVDVPRFNEPLAARLDGEGIDWILLTHKDDIADHEKWANRLQAKRAIHQDDDTFGAEKVLKGSRGKVAGTRWTHVPGHTKGSVVYQVEGVLLTGDHLAGDGFGGLKAFRNACWYDWDIQRTSMESIAALDVERVLPGHGRPWEGTPEKYAVAMRSLIATMA